MKEMITLNLLLSIILLVLKTTGARGEQWKPMIGKVGEFVPHIFYNYLIPIFFVHAI